MKRIILKTLMLACLLFMWNCNDPAPGIYYSAVHCERCLAASSVNTKTDVKYVFPDSIRQLFTQNDSLVIRRNDTLLVKWEDFKLLRYIGAKRYGNAIWQTQKGGKIWTVRIAAENFKDKDNRGNNLFVLVGNVIEGEYDSRKDTIQTRYLRNR